MTKQPTLRYFTQFRSAIGHVRAVIRCGNTRRFITTPIAIEQEYLPALHSLGYIDAMKLPIDETGALSPRDKTRAIMIHTQLQAYTEAVWRIVIPLIENKQFRQIESKTLGEKINNEYAPKKKTYKKRKQQLIDKTIMSKETAISLLQDIMLPDMLDESQSMRTQLADLSAVAETLNERINALRVYKPADCSCDPKHQTYKALNKIKSKVKNLRRDLERYAYGRYRLTTEIIGMLQDEQQDEDEE